MASSLLLLSGRVALVTGGGSGIGRTVCKIFAKEGATVIATDINEAAVQESINGLSENLPQTQAHTSTKKKQRRSDRDNKEMKLRNSKKHFSHVVDVSKSDSVNNLVSKIKAECPVPDILVNCAGITRDTLMLKMTESMFDDVIKVNLKGTYLMTQAISKLMIEAKVAAGSIVNISSVSGKIGNFGQCNYAASKAGVEGFTKTVARELAQYNIRCNAVLPGFIETPMVSTVPDKVLENIRKEIPLKRFGQPEEIADTCAFLASLRSSYITGSVIQVSGGLFM